MQLNDVRACDLPCPLSPTCQPTSTCHLTEPTKTRCIESDLITPCRASHMSAHGGQTCTLMQGTAKHSKSMLHCRSSVIFRLARPRGQIESVWGQSGKKSKILKVSAVAETGVGWPRTLPGVPAVRFPTRRAAVLPPCCVVSRPKWRFGSLEEPPW